MNSQAESKTPATGSQTCVSSKAGLKCPGQLAAIVLTSFHHGFVRIWRHSSIPARNMPTLGKSARARGFITKARVLERRRIRWKHLWTIEYSEDFRRGNLRKEYPASRFFIQGANAFIHDENAGQTRKDNDVRFHRLPPSPAQLPRFPSASPMIEDHA